MDPWIRGYAKSDVYLTTSHRLAVSFTEGTANEVDRSVEDLMYGSTETNDVATTALAAIGKDHRS